MKCFFIVTLNPLLYFLMTCFLDKVRMQTKNKQNASTDKNCFNYLWQRLDALSSHFDDSLRGAGCGGANIFYNQSCKKTKF